MFIYSLSNRFAINCDPAKYSQHGHGVYLANDGIDDMKANVKYEMVLNTEISTYENFVHLYIAESPWDGIQNGDALFISYGRHYWLYKPLWVLV
jgi:hypothetical protein